MPKDEEGNTGENTEEKNTNTGGSTSGQSASTFEGKTAEEWAKSYKGLQGAFQKLQNESTAQIGSLTSQLSDAQTQIETLKQGGTTKDDQLTVLQSEVAKSKETITQLQSDKDSADALLKRKNLVMQDFPELAAWEAQGLLPSADSEEALKEQLEKFRGTLAGQVGATVKDTLKGASPSGSGKTDTSNSNTKQVEGTKEHWWNVMVENSGPTGDREKFIDAQAKYDAIEELEAQSNS